MKTAGMVLALVGGVLGIFGGFCTGVAGGMAHAAGAKADANTVANMMLVTWASSLGGIIFGIVGKVVEAKKASIIISVIVIVAGILAFVSANFFSAPLITLGGVLLMVGSFKSTTAQS